MIRTTLVLILSLMYFSYSFAFDNLKGLKDFKLVVDHQGDCEDKKFDIEISTSIKYLLANSKINLVDERGVEYLEASILTIGDNRVCSSHLQLNSYRYDFAENSAGHQGLYQVESFNKEGVVLASPSEHKEQVIKWFEAKTKSFVVEWSDAQK